MSYTRKTHNIMSSYDIQSVLLARVNEIKDLGVVFDSTLRFSRHVDHIVSSALRTLGITCRITKEFNNPSTFVTLYSALCRPHVEYASVVWNGICATNSARIERVQNKFLCVYRHRFSSRNASTSSNDPAVPIQHSLALPTLRRRREHADILFLYKLVHGITDCTSLISNVRLKIPVKTTRQNASFYNARIPNLHDPVSRIGHTYNSSFTDTIDIFNNNTQEFIRALKVLT